MYVGSLRLAAFLLSSLPSLPRAVLGLAWTHLWPGSPAGAYAMIGAAAMIGAGMQAPLAALVFVLDTSQGSLLFQDSIGAWSGLLGRERPDVAILAAAGRPNRDGEPWQGTTAGFLAEEAAALEVPRVVPCHHKTRPALATGRVPGPLPRVASIRVRPPSPALECRPDTGAR